MIRHKAVLPRGSGEIVKKIKICAIYECKKL